MVLSHWESGEVVLVDGRSGRQTLLTDLPHVSPDRTRGACPDVIREPAPDAIGEPAPDFDPGGAVLSSAMAGLQIEMGRLAPDGPVRAWVYDKFPLTFGRKVLTMFHAAPPMLRRSDPVAALIRHRALFDIVDQTTRNGVPRIATRPRAPRSIVKRPR